MKNNYNYSCTCVGCFNIQAWVLKCNILSIKSNQQNFLKILSLVVLFSYQIKLNQNVRQLQKFYSTSYIVILTDVSNEKK